MIQAYRYERFRRRRKFGWLNFWWGDFYLLWLGPQTTWQFNSDSIHLDFTMLRFDSDSIQHILDSIQTQFTTTSSVIDSTQNSKKNAELNWYWFGIWIDSYISGLLDLWPPLPFSWPSIMQSNQVQLCSQGLKKSTSPCYRITLFCAGDALGDMPMVYNNVLYQTLENRLHLPPPQKNPSVQSNSGVIDRILLPLDQTSTHNFCSVTPMPMSWWKQCKCLGFT